MLGIETSCDETGVGLVRGHTLLADALATSMDEHARFGGVVPEVASRAHLEAMVPTVHRALADAGVTAADVDAIAVTAGPGPGRRAAGRRRRGQGLRAGARQAAVRRQPPGRARRRRPAASTARCPSRRSRCWSPAGTPRCCWCPTSPATCESLGATIDDAAGEAFDKVARVLGLPFPGGPPIDRAARDGDPAAIAFPRGLTGPRDAPYDFSFSGLKTAVARWVEARERAGEPVPVADVAASFQEAVVDVLTAQGGARLPRARRRPPGDRRRVAANSRLRALAEERCAAAGIVLRVPRPRLCTDNGAMVAALGSRLVAAGVAPSAPGPRRRQLAADRRSSAADARSRLSR